MVFDGFELLEAAIKSVRQVTDFISVTYQNTSYFGNPASPDLLTTLENLRNQKLIDKLIFFETNLKIHHKINELNLRNVGLNASREAGCTHHISADVDEFYKPQELEFAKSVMDGSDYDFSIVPQEVYFKDPTYLVTPSQNLLAAFMHPVENEYEMNKTFPFRIEVTRRFKKYDKFRVFTKQEIIMHHMSYVRKDIKAKFANSDNAQYIYKLQKFIENHDTYKLGGRVCLLPDYLNRKTIEVDNIFNIRI